MDYFTDVYLKRINKHGDDLQSRIHGKMACDFKNKLEKSVNRVDMFGYQDKNKKIGVGILETKKISEKETINYLLTEIDDEYKNGFMFYTIRPFSKEKQAWLVLFKEQYETIGYNRYIVILLENELQWIGEDGLIHSSYVHYIGSMDGTVKDKFSVIHNVATGIPSKSLEMICSFNETIKRDLRINISGETWRVCGFDKISVPGVMYVTLEEDYVQKTVMAGEDNLKLWSITSSQGDELVVTANSDIKIDFYCSYNGVLVDEDIELNCDNPNVQIIRTSFNQYKITGAATTANVVAKLKRAQVVTQSFNLTITENNENWIAIVGPNQIKVLQTLEYELATSLNDYTVNIESENDCFKIERIEGNKVYIQGINIGKDNILITHEGVTYSTPINVISPWM